MLDDTDLVSGEEEFRNFLVELGTLISASVSLHGVVQITYLIARQIQDYLVRLGNQ